MAIREHRREKKEESEMDKRELEELSMSNLAMVLQALDEGNIEEARKRVIRMDDEAKRMHDTMTNFASVLLTYIGETYGDEEVVKALRFRHEHVEQDQKNMMTMSPEEAVRHKALIHRGHHSQVTVTEEEDRFVLKLDPCNTGGRLMLEDSRKPSTPFGKVKKPIPESWKRLGISYYCVHCAQNSIVSVEKGAPHPICIYERPKNPNEPCYQYFYKRTGDVPNKYLKELGLKKKEK